VRGFISYCGGLPCKERAGDNPLRSKVSFSPYLRNRVRGGVLTVKVLVVTSRCVVLAV
jgi:hypothetical protein